MQEGERRARELAAQTGGAVARATARKVGFCDDVLNRRLKSDEWTAPTGRVLLLTGAPPGFAQDAWIALLHSGSGAALSHDTSLALWGVAGFLPRPIHVSRDRGLDPPPVDGVLFHKPRLWLPHHVVVHRRTGLPVTTPTRALFELANEDDVHPMRVERAINNVVARRLSSRPALVRMAEEWCKRGRAGSAFMRDFLERHPVDWQPPESNLERRFIEVITEAGFPAPRRQVNVGGEFWIGRVDVKDPVVPLIGEIDSELCHSAPLDVASDEQRDDNLLAAGFHVVRFTEHEIWHEREQVIARWRAGRRVAAELIRRPA